MSTDSMKPKCLPSSRAGEGEGEGWPVGDGDVTAGVGAEGVPLVLPLPALAHAGPSIAIDNPITSNVSLLIHPLFLSVSQCRTPNMGDGSAGTPVPQPGVPQIVRDTN